MKIKALTSFTGEYIMAKGDEKDICDEFAKKLIDAKLAESLEKTAKKKK